MKNDLLVCIAYHCSPLRDVYLSSILDCFSEYKCSLDIIIDTNNGDELKANNITVCVHKNLEHPFHLTWKHRQHIVDNIDNYENFMYIEDDMLLPYENYLNYLQNFKLLYPNFIPSFVRIEEKNGKEFLTDATERQYLKKEIINGKEFTTLNNPYHAFWIMPAKELKESIVNGADFVRLSDSREHAASYPMWGLNLTPLVEIENNRISKKCYSYHLPNNYALSEDSPYGKIKPENLFI